MSDELTPREEERYRICVETILDGLNRQFDIGLALIELKAHKLYRHKFKTFEACCLELFRISRRRAYQLIEATEIKGALPAKAAQLITNEGQARALSDVPIEARAQVVLEAAKTGDVTAGSIANVANDLCTIVHKPQPVKSGNASTVPAKIVDAEQLDKEGWPIPKNIVELWNRAETESKSALALIVKLRSVFNDAAEHDDLIYREVVFNELIRLATNLFGNMKLVVPYAICTLCNGHPEVQPKNNCTLCKGRGFLSQHYWKMHGDDRIKAMRKKAGKP